MPFILQRNLDLFFYMELNCSPCGFPCKIQINAQYDKPLSTVLVVLFYFTKSKSLNSNYPPPYALLKIRKLLYCFPFRARSKVILDKQIITYMENYHIITLGDF